MDVSLLRQSWANETAFSTTESYSCNLLIIPSDVTVQPYYIPRVCHCVTNYADRSTRVAVNTYDLFDSLQYSWCFSLDDIQPTLVPPFSTPFAISTSHHIELPLANSSAGPASSATNHRISRAFIATCLTDCNDEVNERAGGCVKGDVTVMALSLYEDGVHVENIEPDATRMLETLRIQGEFAWCAQPVRDWCDCETDTEGAIIVKVKY